MAEQWEQQFHAEWNSNRLSTVSKSALPLPVLPKSAIRHTHADPRVHQPQVTWLATYPLTALREAVLHSQRGGKVVLDVAECLRTRYVSRQDSKTILRSTEKNEMARQRTARSEGSIGGSHRGCHSPARFRYPGLRAGEAVEVEDHHRVMYRVRNWLTSKIRTAVRTHSPAGQWEPSELR